MTPRRQGTFVGFAWGMLLIHALLAVVMMAERAPRGIRYVVPAVALAITAIGTWYISVYI